MPLIMLADHAAARRFTLFWGGLTGVYLAAVFYRLLALHHAPGLPTYAGFSAVTAVWLALGDSLHPRSALRIGAMVSLFASVTLNAAVITRTVVSGRAVPVARSLFTLLLLVELLRMTLRELRQLNLKE